MLVINRFTGARKQQSQVYIAKHINRGWADKRRERAPGIASECAKCIMEDNWSEREVRARETGVIMKNETAQRMINRVMIHAGT